MYNKFILSLLGNSNLKDDEKGAIVALIVFFPIISNSLQPGKDTFGCVWQVPEGNRSIHARTKSD